ncbi:hypothetical protein NL676_016174 [Syzygium grande]|nr:hypothetical protein NL676_016174 [Syzygium grande]
MGLEKKKTGGPTKTAIITRDRSNDAETEPEAIPLPREVDRAWNCGRRWHREGRRTHPEGLDGRRRPPRRSRVEPWSRGFLSRAITSSARAPHERSRQLKRGGISGGQTQACEPWIWRSK